MVNEALCCQHMEEAEEKGGSAEVEVTMWVSIKGEVQRDACGVIEGPQC